MRYAMGIALLLIVTAGWPADRLSMRLGNSANAAMSAEACEKIDPTMPSGELAGRGCCSHHGGQCGCSGGRTQCCDGAQSPSCRCVKGDPEGSGA